MPKIMLINGSNRIGNTNYLLKKINENIDDTELISLNNKKIEYCRGCLACHKIDHCIIDDDINEIIKKIVEADLIIFGVPNYFDNVSGLFKNFIDRLHPLYKSELISHKKVVFIYVGGGNEEGTRLVLHQSLEGLIKYLKLNVIREYSFKALNVSDVACQNEKIKDMIKDIKSML